MCGLERELDAGEGAAGAVLCGGDEDFGGATGGGLLADDDLDVAIECG
jgi:hypothetical protein